MRHFLPALIVLFLSVAVRADPLLPTAEGTTWEYESTESITGEPGPTKSTVVVRADKQVFEGNEVVKLETSLNNVVTKTELIMTDAAGLVCLARARGDGKLVSLVPAERVIIAPLRIGAKWDQEGEVAGIRMRQHWAVIGQETVTVPARQYLAFHLHCEDSSLMSVKLDRWFVPGTGVVREMTVVRGPGLLHRVTLDLQSVKEGSSKPEMSPAPTVSPAPTTSPAPETPAPAGPSPQPMPDASAAGTTPEAAIQSYDKPEVKQLTVEVSDDPAGGLKTDFKSSVANIYVRWHGHELPVGATVRVAWVAENVGDLVEPNFVVDETESVASTSDASARFTLSRPPDGWAEGKYRVEFYVNDGLVEIVRATIGK